MNGTQSYYTIEQLAGLVGRHPDTVRKHHRLGYLQGGERAAGINGLRFPAPQVRSWAAKHFTLTLP